MPKTFSIMTYNVHSSIGMDGKVSPLRIAEVIARYGPDIVALQELDAGLPRTSMIDQAHLIAASLEMEYHFHSSIELEEGGYGNAILSRFPLQLVKAGPLPTGGDDRREQRGAVWVRIRVADRVLQVVATHFGLNRRERMAQVDVLTGHEWLRHPECRDPVIMCGDLNALPGSAVCRRIGRYLQDAQRAPHGGGRPRGTWPVRFPLMRIDHLYVSADLRVKRVTVPRTTLTTVASDHLPLLVTLEFTDRGDEPSSATEEAYTHA